MSTNQKPKEETEQPTVTIKEENNITIEIEKDETKQAKMMMQKGLEKSHAIAKTRRNLNQIKAQLAFLNQLINSVEMELNQII